MQAQIVQTYHLINLLKRAVLDFRQEEVYPGDGQEAGRCPNVAILWTPAKTLRVNEVGSGECSEPLQIVRNEPYQYGEPLCTYCAKEAQ